MVKYIRLAGWHRPRCRLWIDDSPLRYRWDARRPLGIPHSFHPECRGNHARYCAAAAHRAGETQTTSIIRWKASDDQKTSAGASAFFARRRRAEAQEIEKVRVAIRSN